MSAFTEYITIFKDDFSNLEDWVDEDDDMEFQSIVSSKYKDNFEEQYKMYLLTMNMELAQHSEMKKSPPEINNPVFIALIAYSKYRADCEFWKRIHTYAPSYSRQGQFVERFILEQIRDCATKEDRDEILKSISLYSESKHVSQPNQTIVFNVLKSAVEQNFFELKIVCEIMISRTDFSLPRGVHGPSLEFIREHLEDLGYKGVRDLFKLMLEMINKSSVQFATRRERFMFQPMELVIRDICSREKNYLPAYFVINELLKLQHGGQTKPFTISPLAELFFDVVISFESLARLTSIIGRAKMIPTVGFGSMLVWNSTWKLDSLTLKPSLKGFLPYTREYSGAQTRLLVNIIRQPGSRDIYSNFLLNTDRASSKSGQLQPNVHINTIAKMIFDSCCQPVDLPPAKRAHMLKYHNYLAFCIIVTVQSPAATTIFLKELRRLIIRDRSRILPHKDDFMWMLLHMTNIKCQYYTADDCKAIIEMYHLLYVGTEATSIQANVLDNVRVLAPAGLWLQLNKRLTVLQQAINDVPSSITSSIEFFERQLKSDQHTPIDDYLLSVLLNSYNDTEQAKMIIQKWVFPSLENYEQQINLPLGPKVPHRIRPIAFDLLDTLHFSALSQLIKAMAPLIAPDPDILLPSPAYMESLARLILVDRCYTAFKSVNTAIHAVIQKIYDMTSSNEAQGIAFMWTPQLTHCIALLHALVDLLCNRIHMQHVSIDKRLSMITLLHSVVLPRTVFNSYLYMFVEHAILRHLWYLSSNDLAFNLSSKAPGKTMYLNQILPALQASHDESASQQTQRQWHYSEEMAVTITTMLARARKISGYEQQPNELDLLLKEHCLPPSDLRHFHMTSIDAINQLQQTAKKRIEAERVDVRSKLPQEYNDFRNPQNRQLFSHLLREGAPPVFFVCLWQTIYDGREINPIFLEVAEHLPASIYIQNIGQLADFLINARLDKPEHLRRVAEYVSQLVYQYNLFSMERFLLALTQRTITDEEMLLALRFIDVLIDVKHFVERRNYLVEHVPAQHWVAPNMTEALAAFYQNYPEHLLGYNFQSGRCLPPFNATYFAHPGLNIFPVADIIIQKVVGLESQHDLLQSIVTKLAPFYKFHPMPITFLYRLMLFCWESLSNRLGTRFMLVKTIAGYITRDAYAGMPGQQTPYYMFSDEFRSIAENGDNAFAHFVPTPDYYPMMIDKVARAANGETVPGCVIDSKLNEFSNTLQWAVITSVVELLALTSPDCSSAMQGLIGVVTDRSQSSLLMQTDYKTPSNLNHINAAALIMTHLPAIYINELLSAFEQEMKSDEVRNAENASDLLMTIEQNDVIEPIQWRALRMLALAHHVFQHCTQQTLVSLPRFSRASLRPWVESEQQLIYALRLLMPFLHRISVDHQLCSLIDISVDIYHMILAADQKGELELEDTIVDVCFHLKYQFVGEGVKDIADPIIQKLRPSFRKKFKFISPFQQQLSRHSRSSLSISMPPSNLSSVADFDVESNNN